MVSSSTVIFIFYSLSLLVTSTSGISGHFRSIVMDRRFEVRKQELLAECRVLPQVFRGVEKRLRAFVDSYAKLFQFAPQREHANMYIGGLVSDLDRKNVESIAYRYDQERQNLQHFIGAAEWEHQPLLNELARNVGEQIGEDDGVIVFDPSGFPKKGSREPSGVCSSDTTG